MVDEDPHSPKMPYEKKLRFIDEIGGVKFYDDSNNNKVAILKVKLEDWIISLCNSSRIDIEKFGLEKEPNYLHSIINDRLDKFDKLIDYLLASNNPVLTKMKDFFEIKHRQN